IDATWGTFCKCERHESDVSYGCKYEDLMDYGYKKAKVDLFADIDNAEWVGIYSSDGIPRQTVIVYKYTSGEGLPIKPLDDYDFVDGYKQMPMGKCFLNY
ncbi:MAG: hypothetical protein IKS09_02315, partial [Lachnospiraceae bacterium]|nr:hypothetical protein [Lachnospiraceae bacterium]